MKSRSLRPGVTAGTVLLATLAFTGMDCQPPPAQSAPATPAPTESAPSQTPATGDLRAIIETGLAAGQKEIIVPPGVYRVTPENREHLRFAGLRDVTIVADGVEMVCTETTRAITIEDCHNLTIRGLTIDYDPLPFTQARIVEISDDTSQLTVEVIAGYPEPKANAASVEIFDPTTNRLRGRITYFNTRCEPTESGRAVLTKSRILPELATEQPGDIAVIKYSHAPGGEIPHAIMATDSTGLTFENVTLHAANVFGFFENGCDRSRYIACRAERRAPEDDPVARAHPRVRSLNADAFHSKNANHGPAYDDCFAAFMGDDAIAINGDFHFVTESKDTSLRVLAKKALTIEVGDEIQILTPDGHRLPNRKVTAITADSPTTAEEREFLEVRNMNENLRETGLTDAWQITLDEPAALPPGTLICSADRIGNGFAIRNCHLGFNRSRGILVKAGRGEIRDNHLEAVTMTSILISPEFWWLEAGLSDDLAITGNRITDGHGMGIAILAIGGDGALAPAGAFRNITVENNTITGGAAPGLLLAGISGLTESNNTVEVDPTKSLLDWEIGPWGRDGIEPVMHVDVD